MQSIRPLYCGENAVLATKHAKERVIEPLARRFLGLTLGVASNIDTDAFGTFSRDIARTGSQLDAARAKIGAIFALDPDVAVALAGPIQFLIPREMKEQAEERLLELFAVDPQRLPTQCPACEANVPKGICDCPNCGLFLG